MGVAGERQNRAERADSRREDVLGDVGSATRSSGDDERLDDVGKRKRESFDSIFDCGLTYYLTDHEVFAPFQTASSRVQRLRGLEKFLMERRSAREEGEG